MQRNQPGLVQNAPYVHQRLLWMHGAFAKDSMLYDGIGWVAHSLVVCEEVVDDRRGYHIANAICFAMAQGLERNPHALANLIEAGATCTQGLLHEQLACMRSQFIIMTKFILRSMVACIGFRLHSALIKTSDSDDGCLQYEASRTA